MELSSLALPAATDGAPEPDHRREVHQPNPPLYSREPLRVLADAPIHHQPYHNERGSK